MKLKCILLIKVLFIGYLSHAQINIETTFYQNSKRIIAKPKDIIVLKKHTFGLSLTNKKYTKLTPYTTKIACITSKKDLDILKPGTKINDIPFFKESALQQNSSSNLLKIGANTHADYFYKSDENKNVQLLQSLRNDYEAFIEFSEYLDLENNIQDKLSKLKVNILYLIIYKNENLDDVLDENEFQIFTLKLI